MNYKRGDVVCYEGDGTIGLILGPTFWSNEYCVAFRHHTRTTSVYGDTLEPIINLHADLDDDSRDCFEVLEDLLSR